ncbi:hypothetical protein ACLKA7_003494 [Drosophila subpalustris]
MLELVLMQLLLISSSSFGHREQFNEQLVGYLDANKTHVQEALTLMQSIYSRNCVHIYCQNDQRLQLGNIFQSNRLQLITMEPNVKYIQYKGTTAQAVHRAHLQGDECHEGKLISGRSNQVHYIALPSHSQACYGIYTDQAYNLTLLQMRCDGERVARFALGLGLWMTASTVGESQILCYFVAILLGVHLARLGVVSAALLFSGDLQLKGLQPLGDNFKLLLEQNPTSVSLALVAGAWLLVRCYQRYRSLWRYQLVRSAHFRLLRLLSYYLILGASEHAKFGWSCVSLLLPWPELGWVIHWLRLQSVRVKRECFPPGVRRLLSEEEFQAQAHFETHRALGDLRQRLKNQSPMWEQVAQLRAPHDFARFVCSGNFVKESTHLGNYRCDRCCALNRESQSTTENVASSLLEQLTAVINRNSTTTGSDSAESLYRNLNYAGSTRSLRPNPRLN